MARSKRRPAELLRTPEGPRRPVYLELFFDLVFVFALAQLSHLLLAHLDWSGAFQTLVLLLALWWIWTVTTWVTNLYDPRQPAIQLLVVATMLGGLVMAATAPEAFGARGLVFACSYVAIHVGRGIFLALAMRGRELQRRTLRVLFWFCISAIPWIAGALVHGAARAVLWALAVTVDYTAGGLRYPTPRLGRAPTSEWPIVAEHLAERYRQLFIIALGDLILITGSTLSSSDFATDQVATFLVFFVGTVLFWRIYIFRSGELLPAALAAASDPDRRARSALLAHVLMLAGVVVAAAGDQLVIADPTGRSTQLSWVAVLLGGPALFLAGRAFFEYVVFGTVSRRKIIGLVVLAGLAPAMILLPPLLVAIAGTGVLAGIAISDVARARGRPQEPPAPDARLRA